jgi:hypothetical protein
VLILEDIVLTHAYFREDKPREFKHILITVKLLYNTLRLHLDSRARKSKKPVKGCGKEKLNILLLLGKGKIWSIFEPFDGYIRSFDRLSQVFGFIEVGFFTKVRLTFYTWDFNKIN